MARQQRPRRYIAHHWLILLRPVLRYSRNRDAFVLRGIGSHVGPVLRSDRRRRHHAGYAGVERRGRATPVL
jgi:hypothetical protein